jgi:hypothetical protein
MNLSIAFWRALSISNDANTNDALRSRYLLPNFPWKPLAQEYQLDYGGYSLGFVGAYEINREAKCGARNAHDREAERLGEPK